jgi:glycogen synthase
VPRLLILSHVELTRDPRARRQVAAAAARGFEVVGVCPATRDEPLPLEGATVLRTRGEALAPRLRRAGLGGIATRPQRPLVRELRGLFRLWRFVRVNVALARIAEGAGRFDVVLANEVETLPAGQRLARRSRARLVYDAHEIYASSEPAHPRLHRFALAWIERVLARRADAVLTVSDPIADELHARLGLRERPLVILNAPARIEVEDPVAHDGALRAVYQGAMGPGRPLEDLLDAAHAADGVRVTIRLANADLAALREDVARRGLDGVVTVAEPVRPTELVEALAGEDVGVIINRPVSRNDELVFPNKLFEYMMAGLAVVAPRLPGLAPLVDGEGVGVTFEPGKPESLGARLTELAADRDRVLALRRRARELAVERFNAETEAERLVAALSPPA